MKRTYIYIIVGLVVVVAAWYFFFRTSAASAAAVTPTTSALGTTKSGAAITEAMVQKEMSIIKGVSDWNEKTKAKAVANNRSYSDQLRLEAIWQLQNSESF